MSRRKSRVALINMGKAYKFCKSKQMSLYFIIFREQFQRLNHVSVLSHFISLTCTDRKLEMVCLL